MSGASPAGGTFRGAGSKLLPMRLETSDAEEVARDLLADALPQRWCHVVAVARKARTIGQALDQDGTFLEATAWVHDVGYAPTVAATGFHPLDGARYLKQLGAPERASGLVAFHSSAWAEALEFGVAAELAEYHDERTLTRDLLWYCDMTTGPDGSDVEFEERIDEVRERYGPDHYVTRALDAGMEERQAAMRRSREWLTSTGLSGQL